MSHDQTTEAPTESGASTGKKQPNRFWQAFWLSFLVASLSYAWYCFYSPSNEIAWVENFEAAQEQSASSEKPIILFFTGAWCSPCQIMKRQVWADEEVTGVVNAGFVPVTLDVDSPEASATVERFGVGFTPTTLITDSEGTVLQQGYGAVSKTDFLDLLASVGGAAVEAR